MLVFNSGKTALSDDHAAENMPDGVRQDYKTRRHRGSGAWAEQRGSVRYEHGYASPCTHMAAPKKR